MCEAIARELGDGVIHLESPVERIYVEDGRAVGVKVAGHDVAARLVVSTALVHASSPSSSRAPTCSTRWPASASAAW